MTNEAFDVRIPGGAIRAHRFGDRRAPLVLCVHGLSANARGFAAMGESLATAGHQVVAIDLRGRGRSTSGPAGSYGWVAHANDVLAVADRLEAARFDLVGHSMGAFIGMQLAGSAGASGRLRRLVLVDAVGVPDSAVIPPILAAVARLGEAHASVDAYLARVRSLGTIDPWSARWDDYFRYELMPTEQGVRARTCAAAVREDLEYGATHDPRALWPALSIPTLLVRATRPLGPAGGHVVSAADRDRFLGAVPGARAVEVDANHYGVLVDARTIHETGGFLA